MRKAYHQIGTIYGHPVLVEIEDANYHDKAVIYDYIKNGNLPQWIDVDPKPKARLFENTFRELNLNLAERGLQHGE